MPKVVRMLNMAFDALDLSARLRRSIFLRPFPRLAAAFLAFQRRLRVDS